MGEIEMQPTVETTGTVGATTRENERGAAVVTALETGTETETEVAITPGIETAAVERLATETGVETIETGRGAETIATPSTTNETGVARLAARAREGWHNYVVEKYRDTNHCHRVHYLLKCVTFDVTFFTF